MARVSKSPKPMALVEIPPGSPVDRVLRHGVDVRRGTPELVTNAQAKRLEQEGVVRRVATPEPSPPTDGTETHPSMEP